MSNHFQKYWVLIGVSLASFLGCVDFTIVNTALPAIQASLHASVDNLQWIINIFLLALCALMVVVYGYIVACWCLDWRLWVRGLLITLKF